MGNGTSPSRITGPGNLYQLVQGLRMVWLRLQVSQEKRLASRLGAAPLWLCSYEDHIQPRESLGVIKPQHPSLLCFVLVKQTQAHILFIVAAPPRLESHR